MNRENIRFKSDFLFVRPSLVSSIGRMFDFANNFSDYNYSRTGDEADIRALRNDWHVIGEDIFDALDIFLKQEKDIKSNLYHDEIRKTYQRNLRTSE